MLGWPIARVGPQGWPKRGMKSNAALVMSRSEPEGAPEGSPPPEGRVPQGAHRIHTDSLHKICVHLFVCVQESMIPSLPPPICITHTIAILLRDHNI